MLLDATEITIASSNSPLSFEITPSGSRYIAIEGEKAFFTGECCPTCRFYFQRLGGAVKSIDPEEVVEELNSGLLSLSPSFLDKLQKIIPVGSYRVLLTVVTPKLVKTGDDYDYFTHEHLDLWDPDDPRDDPRTEYYRIAARNFGANSYSESDRQFYEFLIPIFTHTRLDDRKVEAYCASLEAGFAPTAVTLSVFDVKNPYGQIEQCCLSHYLIDGHHKAFAAASCSHSITLVSFLALNEGDSSENDVREF